MIDPGGRLDGDRVLVVDSNYTRGRAFLAVLGFVKVEARLVAPEQLASIPRRELFNYLAIFSLGGDELVQRFSERNHEDNCKYPVVMLVDRADLDALEVLIRPPFIAGLYFQADYYSLMRVLNQARLHNKREQRVQSRDCPALIGRSNAIERINLMIDQVADTNASVLIQGEPGVGKEVIARNIHARCARSNRPFVPINCGARSGELLEGELFGYADGSPAGLSGQRQGRFELAEGGVLFLDEIGDMPISVQIKLLRVLQERRYQKVGSNEPVRIDLRVIAATHHRLEELIAAGRFREDLYYRLNVFPIEVPPLRERREDIPLLIDELIGRVERENRGSVRLAPGAVEILRRCDWPGNVRELANLVERLAIQFPHGVVEAKDLPERYLAGVSRVHTLQGGDSSDPDQLPSDGIDMKQYLTSIEKSLIEQALHKTNNVVAHAASMLHLRRTTLVEKMRKYRIDRAG